MYKPNGSIYIGYFEHGRASGRGVYIFEDGSYYEGDFYNNSAQTEKGKYVSDQLTYTGGFRNNTFDGEAYEEGRDYKFVGWYMNGSRQKGTLTWQVDGKEYRYEGEFNSLNQFHGNGSYLFIQAPFKNPQESTRDSSSVETKKARASTDPKTALVTKDSTITATARVMGQFITEITPLLTKARCKAVFLMVLGRSTRTARNSRLLGLRVSTRTCCRRGERTDTSSFEPLLRLTHIRM